MKTFADDTNRSGADTQHSQSDRLPETRLILEKTAQGGVKPPVAGKFTRFFPYQVLGAMICAILLMDAILPLRDLWFREALLTQLGSWPLAPSMVLFPGWNVVPAVRPPSVADLLPSWGIVFLLLGAFALVCLVYIFALRRLPRQISRNFIIISTLILGLLFTLIPAVTSSDLYSYIAYARIWVIHGLNPLTTVPSAIHKDVIYGYIFWRDQPSAYGPTWTLLTSSFQWFFAICGLGSFILPMVLMLRAWGLVMHISSACLIWSIGGSLQRLHGIVSARKRLFATLAFAWNPLLLLEACTNAHNDTTLLFFILLAIWFLVRAQIGAEAPVLVRLSTWLKPAARSWLLYLAPALLLALGTSLKINLLLLAPGLFFYQWFQEEGQPLSQRLKRVGSSVAVYVGVIVALYAPFWQGGAIFTVFKVNPGTSRSINTLPDTFGHLYNGLAAAFGFPVATPVGSPSEHFFHTLSMGLFVLAYTGLFWQVVRSPGSMRSIHGLVRWMALAWLLYCSIGSPWFWPWYLITFFGLYALIEASKPAQAYIEEQFTAQTGKPASITRLFKHFQDQLLQPAVIRLLTFSMLTLYCLATWGPAHSFAPGLPSFQWSYLTGVWVWLLPLLGLKLASKPASLKASELVESH